jgi:hypothetical protein
MAHIILSGHEIIQILRINELIPQEITDVRSEEELIKFRVRTPWPVLKSIHVGMRFAGYDDGWVVLQLVTNRLTEKLNWLVDKMLEPQRLAEHGGRWEYPRLYLDVNRLVQRQLRGVTVENIIFRDGLFHVTTAYDGTEAPPDGD